MLTLNKSTTVNIWQYRKDVNGLSEKDGWMGLKKNVDDKVRCQDRWVQGRADFSEKVRGRAG